MSGMLTRSAIVPNVLHVSSALRIDARSFVRRLALAYVVLVAMTPVVALVDVVPRLPLDGWRGSLVEQMVGWTLLMAPYVVVLGAVVVMALGVVSWPLRPNRVLTVLIAAVAGAALFATLATTPGLDWTGFPRVLATSMPAWVVVGVVLPTRSRD